MRPHSTSKPQNARNVITQEEVIAEARARFLSNREDLYKVACLVEGSSDPPLYLRGYLSNIHLALCMDKVLDEIKFARSQLLNETEAITRSASRILAALEDTRLQYALVCGPYLPPKLTELGLSLEDLLKRLKYMAHDPSLVVPNGDARSGSGTLRYPWPCSMKLWVAIIIVAAMEYQRGALPKPRNANACDAAEQLWMSIGGHRSGREQARNSWRAYISEAGRDSWAFERKSIAGNIVFRKTISDLRDIA